MVNRVRMLDVWVVFSRVHSLLFIWTSEAISVSFSKWNWIHLIRPMTTILLPFLLSVLLLIKGTDFYLLLNMTHKYKTMYTDCSTLVAINAIDSEQTTQPKLNSIEKRFNHQMNGWKKISVFKKIINKNISDRFVCMPSCVYVKESCRFLCSDEVVPLGMSIKCISRWYHHHHLWPVYQNIIRASFLCDVVCVFLSLSFNPCWCRAFHLRANSFWLLLYRTKTDDNIFFPLYERK